jgi:alkaline phosphatase D
MEVSVQNGFAFFLLFFATTLFAQSNQERLETLRPKNLTRIAFGSCNNQNHDQPLWDDLMLTKPDLWIWGGDVIYADWERHYDIKASYEKQKIQPAYKAFAERTPIIGMWDDHDFAGNNADGTNPHKVENQKLFLDFLEEPANSPRRTQEGIYTSYEFGEEGKRIKVILLDGRYFKGLDPAAPMLGTRQWEWFENELKNSTAQVHLIMTGLSIFSPLLPYAEEWWEKPTEVQRMIKLLEDYKPSAPIFLTGDKHFSTIFRSYGQIEFLSSGMTHVIDPKAWWYLRRKYPVTYFGMSYGMIDVQWEGSIPVLTLSARTTDHQSLFQQTYRYEIGKWDRLWKLWEIGMTETEIDGGVVDELPGPLHVEASDF